MRKLILYCFILIGTSLFSQEKLTYSVVDATSYEQFLMEDFKGLKQTTSDAIHEGIDFYLLRMRVGILAYNSSNFAYAAEHFNAAYSMNPNDTLVQEYLYYSYLYSDQREEAKAYAFGLSDKMLEKIQFSNRSLNSIVFSGGYNFNNNPSQNESTKLLSTDYKNVQTLFNENAIRSSIIINNTIRKRIQIYNGISYYNLGSLGSIELSNIRKTQSYRNGYFQYNLGIGIQFKKGWTISTGFGYYKTNVSNYTIIEGQINPMMQQPTSPSAVFITVDNIYKNFSTSITLGKRFKYFFPTASFHISDFYNTTKTQEELNLTIYPFGNSKLFLTSGFNFVNGSKTNYVFSQKAGFNISKSIFIDFESSTGDFTNRITANGFNTYNSMDKILNNSGVNFHFIFKSKFELITSYYFQQREANYYKFKDLTNYDKGTYKYNNNNLILTLKWNF